jgi:hypothetical protein
MTATTWYPSRIASSDGMSFRDPRTRGAVDPNQLTLWGGTGSAQPELLELVIQRLREGSTSLEQLGSWLLRETSRWRPQDARTAVRELQGDGTLRVEPPDRLTKTSMITLR